MDDSDELALSNFLVSHELTDQKWVSRFHENNITKPDQILPVKGNEELYVALSSGANSLETAALRKILGITDSPGERADTIEMNLQRAGLEPSYWSAVFAKQLGVTTTQALEHVGGEEYPNLQCFARHPWEKKALKKLLKMDDEAGDFQMQRKKRRDKLEKRQAESKKLLQELKSLQKEGKDRHDQEVQQVENGIRERFQISSQSWLSEDASLSQVISKLEECHDRIDGELKTRKEVSDTSVIQNASAGLALQGVLLTKNLKDQLQPRGFLLKVPGDIKLMGPSHAQYDKIKQFTSKQEEIDFTQTVDKLGYSVSASAKAGFLGFSFEASASYSQTSEKEQKRKHHEQKMYSSTVKYSVMPLAACYFSDSQLQLSDDAIKHLQNIEKLVDSSPSSFQTECDKFFNKFGSHANRGILHFGGTYQWISYSCGFKESDTTTVQQLQSEAITLQIGMSYGSFAAASAAVSTSSLHGKFQGKYSDAMMSQTFLEVKKTGVPEVSGLPEWKNGLVASNSTWYLIDRGTTLVPVWDIINMNHTSDFLKPVALSQEMSVVWKKMNGYSPDQAEEQDRDAAKTMEKVRTWNDNQDMSQCIDQLAYLIGVKQNLEKKSMNPKAWPSLYLSQPPLQQFLKSVVESCIQPGSPANKSIPQIKLYMRNLVEPITLGAVIIFPDREYISRWLYTTEKKFVSMDCLDFLSLQKYLQYALNHMYGGMIRDGQKLMEIADQPDISIKATATVAKAVSCLRYHLHKAGQNYEDYFMVTMLFPFKYDPDIGTFFTLLSACDLEYLNKEFENQAKKFFRVKKEGKRKMQAHLFLLALKMQNDLDLAESEVKSHLQYMEKRLESDNDPEVEGILTELTSKHYDWEWFRSQLEFVLQSVVLVQEEDSQPFGHFMETVTEVECVPQTDRPPQKGNKESENLFSMLGLTDFLPQKLTLRHALEIREDILLFTEDIHQVKEESKIDPKSYDKDSHEQKQCTDPKLFPFFILQKIMAFDYSSRAKLICSAVEKLSPTTKDSKRGSTDKDFGQDDDDDDNDTDTSTDDDDDDEGTMTVHPMDCLLALLHCSDNFLRQDLFSRLATCQLAIPLLMPDPFVPQITFPLWAMRSIVKEWKCTQKGRTVSHEEPLVGYRAPLVSFMRFGTHNVSKSHLLNIVMSESRHVSFFHYNCDGGSAQRLLVDGLVEVCWHLPSGYPFPDVISFANLHGDAREFSKQVSFLSKVSFMNFVFLNEESLDSKAIEMLKVLATAPGGLVMLRTKPTADNKLWREQLRPFKKSVQKEKFTVIKLNRNEAEIKDAVRNLIKEKWTTTTKCYTFEEFISVAHSCNEEDGATGEKLASKIVVDEEEEDCVKGMELAKDLMKNIDQFTSANPDHSAKELLLLQSSDFWHKWAMKDKEQYRQTLRGHYEIQEYGAQQRKQMKLIRHTQFRHVQNLTPLMKSFLIATLSHKGDVRNYFLQWLKLMLDSLSREQLPPLHRQYQQKRKELLNIRTQEKVDESFEKACKDEMDELNRKLIHASFGLEHLLREISQIYEAVYYESTTDKKLEAQMFRLPGMAAELMIDGYPLELIDGDAAHVPLKWVSAVLDKVLEKLQDPRVLVLSILGLQSTGKSTLMNTIFGLRFSVSAGRCTRGAFMQLLPINNVLKQECKCDYILIVDTEGLRAPELDSLLTQKHDNELATFVIGLANLTIINILGEVAGDLDDILQTAVHAFLRMKVVNLTPSCHFVHQNVAAVSAGEKGMIGRFKFKEKLDQMTQAAANEENMEGQYRSFSQVIEFNEEHDVYHFPSLWEGDPPMAPVNPGYSTKAQKMKLHLIDFVKQKSLKTGVTRLSMFKKCLDELWNAVLHENFVFSFKNTIEIAAYNTLDAKYIQWSLSFQGKMMKWEQEAQNELKGCDSAKVSTVYKKLTDELPIHVQKIHQELKEAMEKYFEESSERDIIAKWKSDTELRLSSLRTQLKTHAESHCKQLATSRKALAKVDEMKVSHRRRIVEHVKELASQLEQGIQRLSDEELEQKFNVQWIDWITELQSIPVHVATVNVHYEVEKSVSEFLNHQNTVVIQKLTKKPLQEWGSPFKLIVDSNLHIKPVHTLRRVGRAMGFSALPEGALHVAQTTTNDTLKQVREYLMGKQNENFNPGFTNELLRSLFEEIDKLHSDDFKFTSEYKVDMALTACGYALRKFEQMVEAFKKKIDPVEYLEREMRERLLMVFKNQYFQVAEEKTAAVTLCDLLSKSVKKQVISSLSPRIVKDMIGSSPSFQSKPTLKAKILLDIGENLNQTKDFHHCSIYLKNVKRSLQWWIKHYTEQHCNHGEPSRLVQLAKTELEFLIIFIEQTAAEVTQDISPEQKEFNINDWLTEFHGKLQGRLEVDVTELHDLGGIQQLKDVHNFTEEVRKGLIKLQGALQTEFQSLDVSAMDQWERKPYDIIFKNLAGCTEQCPFCHEQCDRTNESHVTTAKHSVTMHRPECLSGMVWAPTGEMLLDLCTSLTGSDCRFSNSDTNHQWHPYKNYQGIYKDWSIPDDKSVKASSYWKWLVANYTSEVAQLFSIKETKISSEWTELCWNDVRKDLEKTYHV